MAAIGEHVLCDDGLLSLDYCSGNNNNNCEISASGSKKFERTSSNQEIARVTNYHLLSERINDSKNNYDEEDYGAGDVGDLDLRLYCFWSRGWRGWFKVNNLLQPSDMAISSARAQDNQRHQQQRRGCCNRHKQDNSQKRASSQSRGGCSKSESLQVLAAKEANGTQANSIGSSNRSSFIIVNNNNNIIKSPLLDTLKLSTQLVFIILTIVPNIITTSQPIVQNNNNNNNATSTVNRPNAGDSLAAAAGGLKYKLNKTFDDYLPMAGNQGPQKQRQPQANALLNGQQSIHLTRRRWPESTTFSERQLQFAFDQQSNQNQKQQHQLMLKADGASANLPNTNQFWKIGRLYQQQAAPEAFRDSAAGSRLADLAQLSTARVMTGQHSGKTSSSSLFLSSPSPLDKQLRLSPQQQLELMNFGANEEQQQLQQMLQQQVSSKQQQPLQLLRQTLGGARLFPTTTMGKLYSFLFPGSPLIQQQQGAAAATRVAGGFLPANLQANRQQSDGLFAPTNQTTTAANSMEPIQFASSNNHDFYTLATRNINQEQPNNSESFLLTANQTDSTGSAGQEHQRQLELSEQDEFDLNSDRTHIINLSAPYESQARPISQQQAAKIQPAALINQQQFELLVGNDDVKWHGDNASVINGADMIAENQQQVQYQQLLAASSSEPAIAGGDETTEAAAVAAAAAQIGVADNDDGSGLVQMDSNHLNSQAAFEQQQQQQQSLDSAGIGQLPEQQQAGVDGQIGDSEAAQLAASFAAEQAKSGSAIFGTRQQHESNSSLSSSGDQSDHNYSLQKASSLSPSSAPTEGEFPELSAEQLSPLQLQHQQQVAAGDGAEDGSGSMSSQSNEGDGGPRELVYSTAAVVPPDELVGNNQSDSETPSSEADESYLTIQLPSQYDNMIRVPPEGYYDDYFKPAPATGTSPLHSGSTADNDQESSSLPPFPIDQFGNHEESTTISNASQITAAGQAISAGDQLRQFSRHNYSGHLSGISTVKMKSNLSLAPGSQQPPPTNANAVATSYSKQYPLDSRSLHPLRRPHPRQQQKQQQQQRRRQLPMKQSEPLDSEQSIEFISSPNSDGRNFTYGNGAVVAIDERQQHQQQPMVSVIIKGKYSNESDNSGSTIAPKSDENPNENSIQLIIANTNSSARDPLSNEKIINYISEPGYNVSRPIGKPARHTFVNKDMNEFPPADEQHHGNHAAVQQQQRPLTTTPTRASQYLSSQSAIPSAITGGEHSPFETENHTRSQQQNQYHFNQQQQQHQQQRPIFYGRGVRVDKQLNMSNVNNDEDNSGERPFVGDEDKQELRRMPLDTSTENTAFGRYNSNSNGSNSSAPASAKVSRQNHSFLQQDQMERSSNENNYARLSRRKQRNNKNNGDKSGKQQQQVVAMANHNQLVRPQVTQASFDPTDLILNPPTAPPTLSAKSAIESVRKLRTNQPDKNELMNELLTALDRVKVAIYKLQPLTAKMNAIYRKSVTTNTRNIIMDNHKGTYAKRYPPGDYDDAYDRLQPSELLERNQLLQTQAGANSNSLRGHGVQQQQQPQNLDYHQSPLESSLGSQSVARATYVSASRGFKQASATGVDSHNNKSTTLEFKGNNQTQHKRFAREAGVFGGLADIKDDGGESMVAPIVATGVGRRLADGRIEGELRLSSDQVNYYDDIVDEIGNHSPTTIMSNAPNTTMTKANNDKDSRTQARATIATGEEFLDTNHQRSQLLDPLFVVDSAAPDFVPSDQLLDDSEPQSPLFGYRITIFQSEPTDSSEGEAKANEQFSYKIDGFEQQSPLGDKHPVAGATITLAKNSNGTNFSPSSSSSPRARVGEKEEADASEEDVDEDVMATSESSVNEAFQIANPSNGARSSLLQYRDAGKASIKSNPDVRNGADQDGLVVQESKGKKMKEDWKMEKKSKSEEKEHKRKGAKAEENKKEKSKKNMSRKKKDEEESKRRKEYKKVKHNKGIVSKEKKSMHRDKHVKAHDRGAAKEKALKERTQIEFFEREQIVDDEYEKGKKSTSKAGWQSSHDTKKSTSEHGGDSMGSLGSGHHHTIHQGDPNDQIYAASGQSASVETSSAKQSNKFEKKNMESKGKKFKGWREKGYKIITETEFIDRGSLHDSGYKKRDKGAAHHQKFKKQESSSEGQHGSMQEINKKSNKKEEKKSKMQEKKDKQSKKDEEVMKEKKKDKKSLVEKKKEKKKKHFKDHEHGESVIRPANANFNDGEEDDDADDEQEDLVEGKGSAPAIQKQPALANRPLAKKQPMLLFASPSTLRPTLAKALMAPDSSFVRVHTSPLSPSSTLMRLLNANHDEGPESRFQSKVYHYPSPTDNYTTSLYPTDNNRAYQQQHHRHRPAMNQTKYQVLATIGDSPSFSESLFSDNSDRRSDAVSPTSVQSMKLANGTISGGSNIGSNTTISSSNMATLEIVDNSTGRQANKTRIGLYELVDNNNNQQTHHNQANTTGNILDGNLNQNPFIGGVKSTLAKYFPSVTYRAPIRDSNSVAKQSIAGSSVPATDRIVPVSHPPSVSSQTKGDQNDQQASKENSGAPLLMSLLQKADTLMQQRQQQHQQHSTTKRKNLRSDNLPLMSFAHHPQQPLIGRDNLKTDAGLQVTATATADQVVQQQQLMQLVQRAVAQGMTSMTGNQQPTNLMELSESSFHQPQPSVQFLSASAAPLILSNTYQQVQAQLFTEPRMSLVDSNIPFESNQFHDYEASDDPLLSAHHLPQNFLIDQFNQ